MFGDATVAAAMIDRLVHHAEVVSLKGDSYRWLGRDEFVRRVLSHQADAALRGELARLAPDSTADLPPL